MQVLAIPANNVQILLPINMVAQIVGREPVNDGEMSSVIRGDDTEPFSHGSLLGSIHWREYEVPVIRASQLIGFGRKADDAYRRVVIVWPMKSAGNRAFVGLTSLGAPKVIDVSGRPFADKISDQPYILGTVQLESDLGIIPDMERLSEEIFRAA